MKMSFSHLLNLKPEKVSKSKLSKIMRAARHRNIYSERNVTEIVGNVFEAPSDHSLAHCVSQDLRMSQGIAWQFKRIFNNVTMLRTQRQGLGSVAILQENNRYIFYLVTKVRYFHKPAYKSIYYTLLRLKQLCLSLNVTKIAMPKIGCGLDRLNWIRVKNLIGHVFCNTNIEIVVYVLPKY